MFPLNVNYDYLDSIHFDKGCFIGQEVNARANFTGVVHKRLCVFVGLKEKLDNNDILNADDNRLALKKYVDFDANLKIEGTTIKDAAGFKTLLLTSKLIRGIW